MRLEAAGERIAHTHTQQGSQKQQRVGAVVAIAHVGQGQAIEAAEDL